MADDEEQKGRAEGTAEESDQIEEQIGAEGKTKLIKNSGRDENGQICWAKQPKFCIKQTLTYHYYQLSFNIHKFWILKSQKTNYFIISIHSFFNPILTKVRSNKCSKLDVKIVFTVLKNIYDGEKNQKLGPFHAKLTTF